MNTKAIGITIAFAAIAIVLQPIRIPALIVPGFHFGVYEIPIVIAFLLFGLKIGFLVGLLHLVGRTILFPGGLNFISFPLGLVAILSMMLGVYLAKKLIISGILRKKDNVGNKPVIYMTLFGTISRAIIMPFLDYFIFWHYLIPIMIDQSIPEAYIISLIPGMILFNLILPLYTIPSSYFIAIKINNNLKIGDIQQKTQELGL